MSAGAAAFEAGSLQDAVFCFQAAADFHPTPPPNVASVALSNLGLVSFLNSHTHTIPVPAAGPLAPLSCVRLALEQVLDSLGDRDGSLAAYARAVAANPSDAESSVQLGRALIAGGAGAEGAAHLRQALAVDPRHVQGLFALAVEQQKGGDNVEAARLCARAVAADPAYLSARVQLAILHALLEDCASSRAEARRARGQGGLNAQLHAGLAQVSAPVARAPLGD